MTDKMCLVKVETRDDSGSYKTEILEVPNRLFDEAVEEKLSFGSLSSWVYFYNHNGTPKIYTLRECIRNRLGKDFGSMIERVKE